jgi:hypothetical protein
VKDVWRYYLEKLNKNPNLYRFTDERRRTGRARLEECGRMAAEPKLENAVQMMRLCIDRLEASAFQQRGQQARQEVPGLEPPVQ